jgi:ABC-type multidrug transport system fused ATPase/permease subunit
MSHICSSDFEPIPSQPTVGSVSESDSSQGHHHHQAASDSGPLALASGPLTPTVDAQSFATYADPIEHITSEPDQSISIAMSTFDSPSNSAAAAAAAAAAATAKPGSGAIIHRADDSVSGLTTLTVSQGDISLFGSRLNSAKPQQQQQQQQQHRYPEPVKECLHEDMMDTESSGIEVTAGAGMDKDKNYGTTNYALSANDDTNVCHTHIANPSGASFASSKQSDDMDKLRRANVATQRSSEKRASCCSRLWFSWVTPFVKRGYISPLTSNDINDLEPHDQTADLMSRFKTHLEYELDRPESDGKLLRAFWRTLQIPLLISGLLIFLGDALGYVGPLLLNSLVQFAENESSAPFFGDMYGFAATGAIFAAALLQSVLLHQHHIYVIREGIHARSLVIATIYEKTLQLPMHAKNMLSNGKITNLMSVDSHRLLEVFYFFHYIWSTPLQIIAVISILGFILGYSALAGAVLMCALVPLQSKLANAQVDVSKKLVRQTDARVELMNEVINGIRIIKFYAWEKFFLSKIEAIRKEEVVMVQRTAYIRALNAIVLEASPILLSLAAFFVYSVLEDEELTAAKAFTALSLFNLLRFPLTTLPRVIQIWADAFVSCDRLMHFFGNEELPQLQPPPSLPLGGIRLDGGEFRWDSASEQPLICDLYLEVDAGELAMCVGGTGTGKSSIVAAMLGEMVHTYASRVAGAQGDIEEDPELQYHPPPMLDDGTYAESIRSATNRSDDTLQLSRDNSGRSNHGSHTHAIRRLGSSGSLARVSPAAEPSASSAKQQHKMQHTDSTLSELRAAYSSVHGKVAYVPQTAWILNMSIRNNILLGRPYDSVRYRRTLHVCALVEDLRQFPARDHTEAGEGGVNLSGGQKQRINIARAVYTDADIYIFDDPLSALDAATAEHIFQHVFLGVLKQKTRLLVTHQLQFTQHADKIILMRSTLPGPVIPPTAPAASAGGLAQLDAVAEDSDATLSEPVLNAVDHKNVAETHHRTDDTKSDHQSGGDEATQEPNNVESDTLFAIPATRRRAATVEHRSSTNTSNDANPNDSAASPRQRRGSMPAIGARVKAETDASNGSPRPVDVSVAEVGTFNELMRKGRRFSQYYSNFTAGSPRNNNCDDANDRSSANNSSNNTNNDMDDSKNIEATDTTGHVNNISGFTDISQAISISVPSMSDESHMEATAAGEKRHPSTKMRRRGSHARARSKEHNLSLQFGDEILEIANHAKLLSIHVQQTAPSDLNLGRPAMASHRRTFTADSQDSYAGLFGSCSTLACGGNGGNDGTSEAATELRVDIADRRGHIVRSDSVSSCGTVTLPMAVPQQSGRNKTAQWLNGQVTPSQPARSRHDIRNRSPRAASARIKASNHQMPPLPGSGPAHEDVKHSDQILSVEVSRPPHTRRDHKRNATVQDGTALFERRSAPRGRHAQPRHRRNATAQLSTSQYWHDLTENDVYNRIFGYAEPSIALSNSCIGATSRAASPDIRIPAKRGDSGRSLSGHERPATHRSVVEVESIPPVSRGGSWGSMFSVTSSKMSDSQRQQQGQLIERESQETGSIKTTVYAAYARALGWCMAATCVILLITMQAGSIFSAVWLAEWSSASDKSDLLKYFGIYAILSFGTILIILCESLLFATMGAHAARKLHKKVLSALMTAPTSFFDVTPVGRIMNRVSRDIDTIDKVVPFTIHDFMVKVAQVTSILVLVSFLTFYFAIAMVPVIATFFIAQQYYRRTSRELKRLDSTSRSPIFGHFSETLHGLPVIRTYNVEREFICENQRRIDENVRIFLFSNMTNRWLGVRLDALGSVIVLCICLFAMIFRDDIDSGLIGLAIGYSFSLTTTINRVVREGIDSEMQMNAVERVLEYADLPVDGEESDSESDGYGPDDDHKQHSCDDTLKLQAVASASERAYPDDASKIIICPASWPKNGRIEFMDVSACYRKGLPDAVKHMSLVISAGERIGVCGRTGAGKSTVLKMLLRVMRITHGRIMVDGIDITKLDVITLRERLSIIPQEPTLFSGTVRFNLDPRGEVEDQELWNALDRVSLGKVIRDLGPHGLENVISEDGCGFSVGQRQLMCLARALIRASRILLIDEATASCDIETDELIQRMLRSEFQNTTTLTIAHRLETILDYDRILVLDAGHVVEFDTPANLLGMKDGVFANLMEQHQQHRG